MPPLQEDGNTDEQDMLHHNAADSQTFSLDRRERQEHKELRAMGLAGAPMTLRGIRHADCYRSILADASMMASHGARKLGISTYLQRQPSTP